MTAQRRFRSHTDPVSNGFRYRLYRDDRALSFRKLFELLEHDDAFCAWYAGLLAAARPEAFFWEHPPLQRDSLECPAEFVLVDAPMLAGGRADPAPFASHFAAAGDADVAVFENLGGDALLVAPCPRTAAPVYAHLAVFLREGPATQVRELWRQVGRESLRLGHEPRWLSTSGLGVAWLHLRFDRIPKYYQHVAYKKAVGPRRCHAP